MGASLALHGGTPVRRTLLPYGRQSLEDSDVAAVVAALRSEWWTTGPRVEEFEREFAGCVGARHAVAVSSGTAALHVALAASGLGQDDEVITTPLTFCATSNSVLFCGARPVFADVEPERLTLDAAAVARHIGPRTRALIGVDFAGHPCDATELMQLAREHDLIFVQDAAHSLGAEVGARRVGATAHVTTFSFHPVKHVACGEGGMLATDDEGLATRARRLRSHGMSSDARARRDGARWAYDMLELGFNYRLSDIACALGRSQLARLDQNLARRRAVAAMYRAALSDLPEVCCLGEREHCRSAWHLFPVLLDVDALRADRDELLAALRAEGIGVNVHYAPVTSLTYYRELGYRPENTPRAFDAARRLLSLPMFHALGDDDVRDVVDALHKVVHHYRR
jgi:UDP-4-amino-4,6-dideoxy-N-acetyl-beta-L-altrosamine transaminase